MKMEKEKNIDSIPANGIEACENQMDISTTGYAEPWNANSRLLEQYVFEIFKNYFLENTFII